jgi:hypothetical protein
MTTLQEIGFCHASWPGYFYPSRRTPQRCAGVSFYQMAHRDPEGRTPWYNPTTKERIREKPKGQYSITVSFCVSPQRASHSFSCLARNSNPHSGCVCRSFTNERALNTYLSCFRETHCDRSVRHCKYTRNFQEHLPVQSWERPQRSVPRGVHTVNESEHTNRSPGDSEQRLTPDVLVDALLGMLKVFTTLVLNGDKALDS